MQRNYVILCNTNLIVNADIRPGEHLQRSATNAAHSNRERAKRKEEGKARVTLRGDKFLQSGFFPHCGQVPFDLLQHFNSEGSQKECLKYA